MMSFSRSIKKLVWGERALVTRKKKLVEVESTYKREYIMNSILSFVTQ